MGSRSASGSKGGGTCIGSTSQTASPSCSDFPLVSYRRHRGDARPDQAWLIGRAHVIFVDSNMKTTIEISDELLKRAKATAALRGESLREFISHALEARLASTSHRLRDPDGAAFSDSSN